MKECELYKKESGNKVKCLACAHKCFIKNGEVGICGVRENSNGKLFLLVYGNIAAEHVDPIEKKPFYHFLPGTGAYSIGTVGCNFKCEWCQNFDISQASKGKKAHIFGNKTTPEEIANSAITSNCKSIAYTYNEPVIAIEFYKEIAKFAKKKFLKNIFITNGYWTKKSFNYLNKEKLIDAMNIDLKCFDEKIHLKYCGAKLKPVLDTIKLAKKNGIHIEITTLIIPGINDDEKQLTGIAKFIAKIDKNIPWHISRFFPMYQMTDKPVTSIETLNMAFEIGKKTGLKNIYKGNI